MIDLYLAPTANGLCPNYAGRKTLIDKAGGFTNLHRRGAAMAARPGVQKGMKVLG